MFPELIISLNRSTYEPDENIRSDMATVLKPLSENGFYQYWQAWKKRWNN
jgi:hypothetical protein